MEEYLAYNYGTPSPTTTDLNVSPFTPKIIDEDRSNLEVHSNLLRRPNMFPTLQRDNELVSQFSEDCVNNHKISNQDQILINDFADDSPVVVDYSSHNNRKLASTTGSNKIFYGPACGTSHQVDPKEKKMVHREIEKQRRKDMATLHASLRSLLPLEFIKGKRSVSDQMNEAVNYTKKLQKDVKELGAKRDELKKFYNNYNNENKKLASSSSSSFISIKQSSNGAVGIEVTSGFRDQETAVIPLSKLLELLFQEGLEVVTCLSTQVNGRLLHSVRCEVKISDCVDLSELRRKLNLLM